MRQKKGYQIDVDGSSLQAIVDRALSIMKENADKGGPTSLRDFYLKTDESEDGYSDSRYTYLKYKVNETNEEMKSRKLKEARLKEQRDGWEREQFEALKKKFGQ